MSVQALINVTTGRMLLHDTRVVFGVGRRSHSGADLAQESGPADSIEIALAFEFIHQQGQVNPSCPRRACGPSAGTADGGHRRRNPRTAPDGIRLSQISGRSRMLHKTASSASRLKGGCRSGNGAHPGPRPPDPTQSVRRTIDMNVPPCDIARDLPRLAVRIDSPSAGDPASRRGIAGSGCGPAARWHRPVCHGIAPAAASRRHAGVSPSFVSSRRTRPERPKPSVRW